MGWVKSGQSLTSIRYVDGRAASKRLATLFGEKVFTNPKDEFLLRDIYRAVGVSGDDIVLDMFAGSGSAMHLSSPTCLVTPDGAEDRLRVGGNLGLEGELLAVDLDRR